MKENMERAHQATLMGLLTILCVLAVNCFTIPVRKGSEAATNCLSEDHIVRSILNEENKTCSELISTTGNHFLCYELKNECCDICRKVADLYQNLTDCLYGDRRDWCNHQAPNSCYDVKEDCCFTCQRLHTGISGCQYGDREDNCKDITAPQCYSGGSETCCLTCQKFETGIPDCQYGDRVGLCNRQKCIAYDEKSRNLCCSTCAVPTTTNVKASPSSSPLILPDTLTIYTNKSGITYMTTLSLGSNSKIKSASGASTDKIIIVTLPSSNASIVPLTAAATTQHNGSNNSDIVTAVNILTTNGTSLVTSYRTSSIPTTGKTFVVIDTMNSTMGKPAITEVSHSSSSARTTRPGSSVTTKLNFPERTLITRHVSSTQIPHIVIPSTASTRIPSVNAAQTFMLLTKRPNSTSETSPNTTRLPSTVSVSLRSSSMPRSSISISKSNITVRLPISSPTAKTVTSPSYTTAKISSTLSFSSVPTVRTTSSMRTKLMILNTAALKTSPPYTTADITSTSSFTSVPTVRPTSSMRTKLIMPSTAALKTVTTKYTMGIANLFPLISESSSINVPQRQTIISPPRTMPLMPNTSLTAAESTTIKTTQEVTSSVSSRLRTTRSYTEVTENQAPSTNRVLPTLNVLTTLESTRMSSSVPTTLSSNILCLIVFYWMFKEL